MIYFAYGSCMNPEDFARTCPSARMICEDAILQGYRLVFNGRSASRQGGVANIMGGRGGAVHGVLWEVPEVEMIALDRREGVPFFYARLPVKIKMEGQFVMAVTYQLNRPLPYEVAPSPAYARLILDSIVNPKYRKRVEEHIARLMLKGANTTCQQTM